MMYLKCPNRMLSSDAHIEGKRTNIIFICYWKVHTPSAALLPSFLYSLSLTLFSKGLFFKMTGHV